MAMESCMLVTTNFNEEILSFYKEVFPKWKWTGAGDGWVTIDKGEGPGGLICAPISNGELAGWYPCMPVEDVNDTLSKVLSQGGSVVLGKNAWHNKNGYYAIAADPQGASFVLREPKS